MSTGRRGPGTDTSTVGVAWDPLVVFPLAGPNERRPPQRLATPEGRRPLPPTLHNRRSATPQAVPERIVPIGQRPRTGSLEQRASRCRLTDCQAQAIQVRLHEFQAGQRRRDATRQLVAAKQQHLKALYVP